MISCMIYLHWQFLSKFPFISRFPLDNCAISLRLTARLVKGYCPLVEVGPTFFFLQRLRNIALRICLGLVNQLGLGLGLEYCSMSSLRSVALAFIGFFWVFFFAMIKPATTAALTTAVTLRGTASLLIFQNQAVSLLFFQNQATGKRARESCLHAFIHLFFNLLAMVIL